MPIIKSAQKRARQAAVRTARNRRAKRQFKEVSRELEAALSADKKSAKTSEVLRRLQSVIDTLEKKNIIHKNKAARLKARWARLVKNAGAKPSAKPATKKRTSTSKPATARTNKRKAAKKSDR